MPCSKTPNLAKASKTLPTTSILPLKTFEVFSPTPQPDTPPFSVLENPFRPETPYNLVRHLRGHEIVRAAQMGWSKLRNGLLLEAAEQAGFALFITCDQNIEYQQDLRDRQIVTLAHSTNNWPIMKPHLDAILVAVEQARLYAHRVWRFFKKKSGR
jgi:hypothetical protein